MKAILVDDEPLARERMRVLLEESGAPVEVVAEAGSGQEAVPLIHDLRPDVVFLDVQMPVLDGFDVVDLLARPRPHVVFVTAYDEYALRAFDVHALDYLTKPVRLERLQRTLERVAEALGSRNDAQAEGLDALRAERGATPLQRLTVHVGRRLRVVQLDEIRWIEASDKLVFVHLADGRYHTDFTLDELEARLDRRQFLRTHRSCLVNAAFVRELVPWFSGTYKLRLRDGAEVPLARRRVQSVKELLGS